MGGEFLKKPFVSSDSVDMLIKRRKGKWSERGGLGRVGVIGRNGMSDEFLQVSRLLQSKGGSVELGSADQDLCCHCPGAAEDYRKG